MHVVQYLNPDLRIPVGLARFMKKWGFTRMENGDNDPMDADFCAINNGQMISMHFLEGDFFIVISDWNQKATHSKCVKELNKFMKDSQK